jgi:hypothetical protein
MITESVRPEVDQLLKNARPGQRAAFLVAEDRITKGKPYTTIVLPTRYGKSDLARLLACWLKRQGLIYTTLILSPNQTLRQQMIDEDEIATFRQRFPIPNFKFLEILGPVHDAGSNDETLLSATIQSVQRNLDICWIPWVNSVVHRTGRRPLIIIDESHTGSESNEWGGAVRDLIEAGAIAVLMTATPERADGRIPSGFESEILENEPITKFTTKQHEDPRLITVDKWSGHRRKIRLIPDYEMTFAEAWKESPSPLCIIGNNPYDIDLWKIEGGKSSEGNKLSTLSAYETRSLLGKLVKDDLVIDQAIMRLINDLKLFKRIDPKCAAIVFCGNDDEPEKKVNQHAMKVKKAIEDIDPTLDVLIVTSMIDSDDPDEAGKRIRSFRNGKSDVLIVKQMASLGISIPRCKVGVDLSPIRTYAALIQRMMRIATPFGVIRTASWISPKDILSQSIFKLLVTEDIINRPGWRTSLEDLIDSYIKEKEADLRPIFGVNNTEIADFEDSKMNWAEAYWFPKVEALFSALPPLASMMSHSEAARRLCESHITIDTRKQDEAIDVRKELQKERSKIRGLCTSIIMKRLNGSYDRKRFEEESVKLWNRIIYPSGLIPPGIDYDEITNIENLKSIYQLLIELNEGSQI